MSEIGEKIIQHCREVASENPDYVNNPNGEGDCFYVTNDRETGEACPSCLVGQGMWRAGVANETWLAKRENQKAVDDLIEENFAGLRELTSDEKHWLLRAQRHQDNGKTWAEAIEYADWLYACT